LLFFGADTYGKRFEKDMLPLIDSNRVVVFADIISGVHGSQTIANWDALSLNLSEENKKSLQPDLLISFGKFTVSKGFKQWLKKFRPVEHWHITPNHTIADPFQSNPVEMVYEEEGFFLNG